MAVTNHGSGGVSVLSKDNAEKILFHPLFLGSLPGQPDLFSTAEIAHVVSLVFCAMGFELELGSVPC